RTPLFSHGSGSRERSHDARPESALKRDVRHTTRPSDDVTPAEVSIRSRPPSAATRTGACSGRGTEPAGAGTESSAVAPDHQIFAGNLDALPAEVHVGKGHDPRRSGLVSGQAGGTARG